MNVRETRGLITKINKLAPGFLQWATKTTEESARIADSDPDEEWSGQLESWTRTLSTVTVDEADLAITQMEIGEVTIPPFGDLFRTILREAKQERSNAILRGRIADPEGPTVTCLYCRGTGIVTMWNPRFVEAYRESFAEIKRSEFVRDKPKQHGKVKRLFFELDRFDPERNITAWLYDPPNWQGLAQAWWRRQQQLPMKHAALCCCDCERQQRLTNEMEKFKSNIRKTSKGNPIGMPACGAVRFNPHKMMFTTPFAYDDLAEWYASHTAEEVKQWQPA